MFICFFNIPTFKGNFCDIFYWLVGKVLLISIPNESIFKQIAEVVHDFMFVVGNHF